MLKQGALTDLALFCPHCRAQMATLPSLEGAVELIGGDVIPGGHEVCASPEISETFDQVMLTGCCLSCTQRFEVLVVKSMTCD